MRRAVRLARSGARRERALLALTLGLALVAACGPRVRPEASAPPPPSGTLHRPSAHPIELTIDQEVTAEHASGSERFRAVLEKRGDRLVMVGLGPAGERAFTLVQEGDAVRFESRMPRELPFPPEYILMDVHRTWLAGLPREGAAALPDGEHEATIDGERVRERWQDGRLRERHFRPLAADAGWAVDIVYEGGLGEGSLPVRVVVDETPAPDQRYRLVLDHLSGTWSSVAASDEASAGVTSGGEAQVDHEEEEGDAPGPRADGT